MAMKRIGWMLSVWMLIVACSDQTETEKNIIVGDNQTIVRLTLDAGLMTKANVTTEATVNELALLVFEEESGSYSYKYSVQPVRQSANTYEATLKSTDSGVKLYALANASPLPSLSEGAPEADLIQAAVLNNTAAGPEYLPMYGDIGFAQLPENGSVTGTVSLLRAVASVQVDAGKVEDKFILKSIQGYRANSKIQVIPDTWTLNEAGEKMVTAPSVPAGVTSLMTDAVTSNGGSSIAGLYLPEAVSYSDQGDRIAEATCLIIGGVYLKDDPQNTAVTYYRIDFKNSSGEDFGQLLRNHKYKISITEVSGPGEASPQAAGEKEASHMDNNLIVMDDDDDGIIHGPDGTFIALETNLIRVNYFEGAEHSITVESDPQTYTIQWIDANGGPMGRSSTSRQRSGKRNVV